MTWKGTFCTEYAWSLCGSSLLFSRACGRPQAATNTPRSPPNLFAFLSSHSSLLPPTHFCSGISPSLALQSPAPRHSSQLLFALLLTTIIVLAQSVLLFFGRSCFVRRRCCGASVRSVAGSWGRLKLCRCVCVSILVLIVFIAYEAEHLRQGLRVRVLN